MMNEPFESFILKTMNASSMQEVEVLQTLWSGYGKIIRVQLQGSDVSTLIVKNIDLPTETSHPRGWNTDHSHSRKVKSYQIESAWYAHWSQRCSRSSRVPVCYGHMSHGKELLILLEDLDASGFPERKSNLSKAEIKVCLHWLASFHATFMQERPTHLWEVGTYWHLETRPDELAAMEDKRLQDAASLIDQTLNACRFQTFVHGDAKVANFCFSSDGSSVAAVDFQYVGGGCGMKDVVYFLGSCLEEELMELWEEEFLNIYFVALQEALHQQAQSVDVVALEQEWRAMYPMASTDFYRFLLGWMPTHWKINGYTKELAEQVLDILGFGSFPSVDSY